jgi:hypothetical protein
MQRYNNGKIYAIRSYQTDRVYIGSTCMPLAKRLYAHRKHKERFEAGMYNYVTSYEMLEFDDHYIELVEEHPCDNKMQLERREGQIMRATENTVNMRIAGRTDAEYYRDNAEKIKEQMKEYKQRPEVKQRMKQYHQRPEVKQRRAEKHECDCGGKYTTGKKSQHPKTKQHMEFEAFMALTEEQVRANLFYGRITVEAR